MKLIKIIVLRTAGTNCDVETAYAFRLASTKLKLKAEVDVIHINKLIQKKIFLNDYHILAIPGGFSYGDDIAAGKILANELKFMLKDELIKFVQSQRLVIGICNGFQVLVSTGILPGHMGTVPTHFRGYPVFEKEGQHPTSLGTRFSSSKFFQQTAALTFNDSNKFEDRWVYLKSKSKKCIFTKGIDSKIIYLPVAHGEGKFVTLNRSILNDIIKEDLVVFEYVDERGIKTGYPGNPNGSLYNIAGICNKTGNVLGLMPHPERHITKYTHPRWTREDLPDEGDGLTIFKNALAYIRGGSNK